MSESKEPHTSSLRLKSGDSSIASTSIDEIIWGLRDYYYSKGQYVKPRAGAITDEQAKSALRKVILSAVPEKRRVNHDRCTWIYNGRCVAHKVNLTDKEISVIFYENETIDLITKNLEGLFND